jgi:exodeoxyribonuclease V alpha subunit
MLSPLDRHFAAFMERLSGDNPALSWAAALVSYFRSLGHACLDLNTLGGDDSGQPVPEEFRGLQFPKPAEWVLSLRSAAVVGKPGEFRPLILDDQGRLYLHRYWKYESDLARAMKNWAQREAGAVNWNLVRDGLSRLFPATSPEEVDWQKVAAFAALRKKLCIISGGPGTGKTRTVVILLALLLEQAGEATLRIALVAPTGKAAARLQESVKAAKTTLACAAEIKAKLPEEAATIHRLLGTVPGSAFFRHDADNPLPVDVVVVDEASMVDLALMAKLVAAIPPTARLILLGDKDQLASVEAGAVLADLCDSGKQHPISKNFASQYATITGNEALPFASVPIKTGASELSDCIIELRKNYRFGESSGIYALSRAVNEGAAEHAIQVLKFSADASRSEISSRLLPEPKELKEALRPHVLSSIAGYLKCQDPLVALQQLSQFRILCALRNGPFGVENLNRLVEEILVEDGLIRKTSDAYAGRPVMITRNDYSLRLFNGDIGVLLPDKQRGELRAYFSGTDNNLRDYSSLRLPDHETVYAMTVHKSQGSEFRSVLLILPSEDSPILTRELVYTGLTRASKHVELWMREPVLRSAVARKIIRSSGLRDALWKASPKAVESCDGSVSHRP